MHNITYGRSNRNRNQPEVPDGSLYFKVLLHRGLTLYCNQLYSVDLVDGPLSPSWMGEWEANQGLAQAIGHGRDDEEDLRGPCFRPLLADNLQLIMWLWPKFLEVDMAYVCRPLNCAVYLCLLVLAASWDADCLRQRSLAWSRTSLRLVVTRVDGTQEKHKKKTTRPDGTTFSSARSIPANNWSLSVSIIKT